MILIIALCVCQWFGIFKTGNFIYKADLINISTIFISIVIIIILSFEPILQKKTIGKYRFWIVGTILLWIFECVNSAINYAKYGQSFFDTIAASFGILSIISLLPLCYLQEKIRDKNYLKNLIKNLGFVAALLSIVQVFLYDYNIIFLDISGSSTRYGSLRFSVAGYMVSISVIITLFDWIKTKRGVDLVKTIIEIIFLIYAQKTRTEIIYVILAVYFVSILFLKNKNAKVLLFILGILALFMSTASGFTSSFLAELDSDAGINMRFETINFYMKQFYDHPILGMGFIRSSTNNATLYGLLYGSGRYAGYFYRDDVGIIGVINEKGILGIIWYCLVLILILKQVIFLYRFDKKENVWMLCIWVYILICSINIIWVNNLRIASLSIIIALIQHYYYMVRNSVYEE